MEIEDANNGDSNESSSAASSSSSSPSSSPSSSSSLLSSLSLSSLSSLRHHSSEGINRKQKFDHSTPHRHSIQSRRVYTNTEVQE